MTEEVNLQQPITLYALTDGEYSDYHIEELTSSYEVAKALSEKYGWEIEDYPNVLLADQVQYGDYVHVLLKEDGSVDNMIEALKEKMGIK